MALIAIKETTIVTIVNRPLSDKSSRHRENQLIESFNV